MCFDQNAECTLCLEPSVSQLLAMCGSLRQAKGSPVGSAQPVLPLSVFAWFRFVCQLMFTCSFKSLTSLRRTSSNFPFSLCLHFPSGEFVCDC